MPKAKTSSPACARRSKIAEMAKDPIIGPAFKELEKVRKTLEKNFGDVQDFEFTIEKKKLFMLQTRNGKRTALAYVKIAHDMVKEKLMTPEHAIRSGDPEALNQLLAADFRSRRLRAGEERRPADGDGLAGRSRRGLRLGGVHAPAKAEELAAQGKHVVLARIETSPEDLRGMIAADGILTCRGGVSSHAALVARQMGKVCVAGAGDIHIDYHAGTLTCDGVTLTEGDPISINGSTGEVFNGAIATADSELKQVLVGKTLKPADSPVFQVLQLADEAGRQVSQARHSHQRRSARPGRPTPSRSGPKASACAAPSTCSSKATGSTRCAR